MNNVADTCSRYPSTVTFLDVKEHINQHLQDNWTISNDEIASEMSIGCRKQCECLRLNSKHDIRTLWTAGPNSLKHKTLIQKNDTSICCVLILSKLIKQPLNFDYLCIYLNLPIQIYLCNDTKNIYCIQ